MIGHVTKMSLSVVVELRFASPLMLYVMVWMIAQMAKMRNQNSVVSVEDAHFSLLHLGDILYHVS